jgi:hypothetical protein
MEAEALRGCVEKDSQIIRVTGAIHGIVKGNDISRR